MFAVHVTGDFLNLAFTLKQLDHESGALTDVRVRGVSHAALERIQSSDIELTKRL